MQDFEKSSQWKADASLRVFGTFVLVLLVSLTRNFMFVMIVNVYLLAVLSLTDSKRLIQILKMSFGITLITAVIMLPALFWGNSYSAIMITNKVFATITAMGLLSHTTKWNVLTEALKKFYVPDLFILILDITIKYIYMLGELSLNFFYALKLRSVGKNHNKYNSMAGIAGNVFLQSKELSEEMYHAMECRGFTGEYHIHNKTKFKWQEYLYLLLIAGFIILFFYFGRT